jgi:hypothetical protein
MVGMLARVLGGVLVGVLEGLLARVLGGCGCDRYWGGW